MKIRYNTVVGVVLLAFVFMDCCLTAFFIAGNKGLGPIPAGLVAGFWIGLIAGILYLTQTYFEVAANNLVIRSLVGITSKTYAFNSSRDFSIEGKKVYLVTGGKRIQLPLYAWLADKRGWTKFIQWIQGVKTPAV
ncbi:MAG TPA: hypothetical protein VMC09_12525 [Anaerolineales bacterium]|nr:hypothetical protein [Anaerolineales bacterium]